MYWLQIHQGKIGIGRPNVNSKILSEIILPPLKEQHKIIDEIEQYSSTSEQVEKTMVQSLMWSERPRQSILKGAFEGKLVPQDPQADVDTLPLT
jgi:type I restriction enzyme S subunit